MSKHTFSYEELAALGEEADQIAQKAKRMAVALRWAALELREDDHPPTVSIGDTVSFRYGGSFMQGSVISIPGSRSIVTPPYENAIGVAVKGRGGVFWPTVFRVIEGRNE